MVDSRVVVEMCLTAVYGHVWHSVSSKLADKNMRVLKYLAWLYGLTWPYINPQHMSDIIR